VNEQLERLIHLQKIDSKILATNRIIEEFPSKIEKAELPLKEFQKSLNNLKQRLDAHNKRKHDRERELDDTHEKIKRLKARTSEIKTNKEYQALLKEIESVEKERSSIEDEILIVMEEMDAASKQMKSQEQQFRADSDKIGELKKRIENERSEVEKELLIAKDMRSKITETIDEEIYGLYVSLVEACNGLVVTEAKDEICQGCNMNIPPQLFVEIKKNDEIINCPQCRRILYYKNST
jgi:predicted  nucleic acid-binding Zn-ribbon protein